jgi:predicted RNA-binding Zn-ribbon protein involved in translation (DUF1610 family)
MKKTFLEKNGYMPGSKSKETLYGGKKRCKDCDKVLPLDQFFLQGSHFRYPCCKECKYVRDRKRYAEQKPSRVREYRCKMNATSRECPSCKTVLEIAEFKNQHYCPACKKQKQKEARDKKKELATNPKSSLAFFIDAIARK